MTTKEKIKNAAKELFLAYGYTETTMRMIADLAEERLGSIVYHFKTKDNLATVIYDEILDEIFGHDLLKGHVYDDPIQKLFMNNIRAEIVLIQSHKAFYSFFIELINEDVLPNVPHKYTVKMYQEVIDYYGVKVAEDQANKYMIASKGVERILNQKATDDSLDISRLELNRLIVTTSLLLLGINKENIDSAIDRCIEKFTPDMLEVLA